MKRNFIHLPFNMLFYLILKDSENGALYGLNKETASFIAHHETKRGLGAGRAGSDRCRVTGRGGQPRPGRRLQGAAGIVCSPQAGPPPGGL